MIKPTLAVVGAGKVGTTLSRLLFARGYTVTAIYSRTPEHAEVLAQAVGAQAVTSLDELHADLVLLSVPDDVIESVAAGLVGFSGAAVIHTSGARDASALATLAVRGIQVGSLHPAFPFADAESAIEHLAGATFALEAQDEPLIGWLNDLVAALDGRALLIPPGSKGLYHAALCIASNYTVTLYALAESLLTGLGADKAAADQALDVLMAATVENLRVQGIPAALTGPLVRADVGTVAAHLDALHRVDDNWADLYRQLARSTYPLLRARGIAPDTIEQLLRQDVEDAHHSP